MSAPILFFVDDLAEGVSTAASAGRFHQADPAAPQINVMDLSVTRGDGIFETAGVQHGKPMAIEAHLARFAHSAALLDLPAPKLDVWAAAIEAAITAHSPAAMLSAKFIMTRGIEGTGVPVGWVYVFEGDEHERERENGISVVTLDRGYRHDVAKTSPWLLQGAKTLSYAVNKAVLREAARRGADDVIFISSDGFVLEGPTSSVILLIDGRFVTPSTDQGILAGTTQADAFAALESLGHETEYREVVADELGRVDGLWMLSSTRCAAPVRELDGQAVPIAREITDQLNDALLTRTK
ncbi:aminodeoxychorismate lyase [Pseudoclavibacter sp. 13-3]|uniref:aminodeoxychorismate lyase n=1 Tax=Pseudoclavibacter sp. 13-3 TaxID=2901228 RepID=UPI001E5D8AAC|nr:aminodeoxychorismate lyase [Pseudoclavibacter sp. 13-3]MCD7101264.1 aminodeoxychorismate lyase [Pseudoclavibacter sp. 13-3]